MLKTCRRMSYGYALAMAPSIKSAPVPMCDSQSIDSAETLRIGGELNLNSRLGETEFKRDWFMGTRPAISRCC